MILLIMHFIKEKDAASLDRLHEAAQDLHDQALLVHTPRDRPVHCRARLFPMLPTAFHISNISSNIVSSRRSLYSDSLVKLHKDVKAGATFWEKGAERRAWGILGRISGVFMLRRKPDAIRWIWIWVLRGRCSWRNGFLFRWCSSCRLSV